MVALPTSYALYGRVYHSDNRSQIVGGPRVGCPISLLLQDPLAKVYSTMVIVTTSMEY